MTDIVAYVISLCAFSFSFYCNNNPIIIFENYGNDIICCLAAILNADLTFVYVEDLNSNSYRNLPF